MIHMGISKAIVLSQLEKARDDGARTTAGILSADISIDAAIENLKNDPREVITGCSNVDSRGYCRGCPETKEKQ